MKHKKSILEGNIIYTLFAILIGFLTGAIILAIAGMNPGSYLRKIDLLVFSAKPKFLAWSVVYATPLIFTGLSVAFSFRTGVFNIGAEGQFVVGSLAATVIGMCLSASGNNYSSALSDCSSGSRCCVVCILWSVKGKKGNQ